MRYALLTAGGLLLAGTIALLFISNFTVGILLQGFVAAVIILYALYLNKIPRKLHIAVGAACLIPVFFSISLAVYGNIDTASYDEDVVIVLGAGIRGERVPPTLAKRLDKAVVYYGKNPGAVIIVCGGQGPQEDITEALAMERYLVNKGIPQSKIIKEEESTSTYENFLFARKVLEPHFPQGFSAVLITNSFHIYRASKFASYAGIPANRLGAPTVWYTIPVNYLREMLAVVKIWVMPPSSGVAFSERTPQVFPTICSKRCHHP